MQRRRLIRRRGEGVGCLLTSIMGMGPLWSHFRPLASAVSAVCGRSGSSKYRVVPGALPLNVSRCMRGFSAHLSACSGSARTGNMVEDRVFEDAEAHDGGGGGGGGIERIACEGSERIHIAVSSPRWMKKTERSDGHLLSAFCHPNDREFSAGIGQFNSSVAAACII